MTERLSDDELRAAIEDHRAMIAGDPDAGYALTNGDVLRLLEELAAAREREATGLFEFGAVTRVEVITGRRDYVRRFPKPGAALAVQDDGRTLKVFIDMGGDDDDQ